MKTIKNIFGILLAMVVTTAIYSCEDEPEYTPAVPETGKINVYFAGSATSQTFEVEPGTTTFDVTLERQETTDAATVELMVVENQDNVFKCPSTVNFAAGQKSAAITVDASAAEDGIYYDLTLRIVSNDLSNYTEGNRDKTFTFAIMKWEKIGTGFWTDGLVGAFFGVENLTMAVELEKATTSTSTRFRFASPYAAPYEGSGYIDDAKKYEFYLGHPYNVANKVPGDYEFVIICDLDGTAKLQTTDMGIDWGYGMFSTGQVHGSFTNEQYNDLSKYPLGTYDEKKGVVKFPANSLFCDMADYGTRIAGNPSTLYLSDEDFLNNQSKEIDYDADFVWAEVEDGKGTFISTAVDDKWIQPVEEATDAADVIKDLEPTTKVYRFPSLYAAGKNIVFYLDTKENLISMPKEQETGLTAVGNAPILVDMKSATVDADGVYTFNLTFYTVDEDGEKVSDLGTITETFKWGYTGVRYEDLKGTTLANYAGDWTAPFMNMDTGAAATSYVTVAPVEGKDAVAIQGLSGIGGVDDTVIAEYNPANGLLYLPAQNAAVFQDGYQTLFSPVNVDDFSSPAMDATLVGGFTADGVFAFVNSPANATEVNSVYFLAVSGNSLVGWFNSYVPYPLEWTPYVATKAFVSAKSWGNDFEVTSLSDARKKSDVKTFSSRHTATKWNAKKLIEGNNVIR